MSDTSREKNIYRNAWSHWQSWMASRLVLVKASCPVILSQRGWYVLLEVSIFLAMDVACILIVKSARTFEPLLLPRRCMIRVRDRLMWKGCDPCHDFRV